MLGPVSAIAIPTTPKQTAGRVAQDCGCDVRQDESTASNAKPNASESNASPVITDSLLPPKTSRSSSAPAAVPPMIEPSTTRPM